MFFGSPGSGDEPVDANVIFANPEGGTHAVTTWLNPESETRARQVP